VFIVAIVGSGGFLAIASRDMSRTVLKVQRMTQAQWAYSRRRSEVHAFTELPRPGPREPKDYCTYNSPEPTWAVFGDSHVIELSYASLRS